MRFMGRKEPRISGRISEELRERLDRIHARLRTDDSDFIRDGMAAIADYVERTGGYEVPLRVDFDRDAAEHANSLAAEGPAPEEIRKHAANLLSNSARAGAKTAGSATPQPTPTPHARKRAARE